MEEVQVWDPRRDENYTLEDFSTKELFSSLDMGLLVVEAIGIDWNDEKGKVFLHGLLRYLHTNELTVIVFPWLKESVYKTSFPDSLKVDYSQAGYVIRSNSNELFLDNLLGIRERLGGSVSGEWIVIGSKGNVPLDKECLAGGFSKILGCLESFEFLICMAEMQQNFIMFKPSSEIDPLLKGLISE